MTRRNRRIALSSRSVGVIVPTFTVFFAAAITPICPAQSLEERLDERRYLEGLRELDLPEVLDHYLQHHQILDDEEEFTGIAEHRSTARDRSLPIVEREAAIDRVLAERNSLIADQPGDPRVASWLADQAADLYFEYLGLEASGWTTLLGVPSESQRLRTTRAAQDIFDFAGRAEIAVEQAILDVERAPGFAENLNLQRERRRLAEQERDRRIPFFIGIGASLRAQAEVLDDRERNELLPAALDVLQSVAPRLDRPLAAEARVHAGLAAARLGRTEEAERLFDAADVESATGLVRFASRLSRASLRPADTQRNLERLAAYAEYSRNIFYRLLIADRLFLHRKGRNLREALNAYADLLEVDLDTDRQAARAIILARVADAVAAWDPDQFPPFAVIARAERDLHRGTATPDAVEAILKHDNLSELERAHALLTAARIHHQAGDALVAARRYIELARDHTANPESVRAIEMGLALASDQYRSSPRSARDTLYEGLQIALRSYPRLPSIDRWKFVAGRLAMNDARYDEAIEHLSSIARGHELWIDGRVLRVETLRRAAMAEDDTEGRSQLFSQLIEAAETLDPELERAMDEANDDRWQTLRRHVLNLRIQRAAALTDLGEPQQAFDLLDGFERDPDAHGPLIAEALQARIAAFQAMERVTEAQAEIDRFIEHSPERAAAVLTPMLVSIERRVRAHQERDQDHRAERIAREELAPLAARLDDWMNERAERFDSTVALRIADAHLLAEEYGRALRLYDRLLADHPGAGPLLFGKAECLYHLGKTSNDESQLAEAMTLYRRIAQAGSDLSEMYWQSQLRSLQILDATNRNTHQIAPQIQRLRLRDPDLGGDRFRTEFDRLLSKHTG